MGATALAAIVSTGDAFLNLGAAALARGLPRALGHPGFRSLGTARLGSLVVALAALAVAALHLAGGGLIAFLGTLGFGASPPPLPPTLLLGLAWDRVTARAAAASMATGLATLLALEVLAPNLGPPAAALAMAGAFAVLPASSLFSQPPTLPARMRVAMRS